MDIHHLRIFLSVFRNRSFSKASRELRLSQPTVSDHIKSLEDHLECALFERLGRKIIPTGEAEVLYNYAIEVTEKADGIRHAIGQFKKEVAGELIIGASSIPGTYLLPSLVATFKKTYPEVSFQVLVSDSKAIVQKVLQHEILLGLVGSRLNSSQISSLPFMEDELIVVSSPPMVKGNIIKLKDLSKYPMVIREEGSGTRREAEKLLEAHGFSMETMLHAGVFGSTDAVKQAVKAGLGIAVVSKYSVEEELKHETLKEIKITNIRMKRSFYVATHKKRSLPRLYQLFLEHLKSQSK
ncbi:MAG: selenium metabolism-associated LysR family transcriptional regulator [Nitrospirota bacterium]